MCSQGKGQRWFQRNLFSNVEREDTKPIDAGRKGKEKEARDTVRKEKGGSQGNGWSKGKWSNPGHTWDSSWYNSQWHGKTFGLEVDPWSAVEPVPYLCAVSLCSSCEEFSEPKRMTKGTHTKTSQPESPMNFVHVNKFSTLAPDDCEFTGEGCTSLHTSRSQCPQRKMR